MAKQANRLMIGGFVVLAVVILAASLVVFGSGKFFKQTDKYVLYFDGSVKGLNVGSPVLYQGVQVGTVTKIVIRSYVKDLKSYIPVFVEVYPEKFELIGDGADMGTPQERVKKLIDMGLRAQLVTQSMITGQLLIEVGMYPDTPINLKGLDKGYTEIPTIPSTMARLGKALEKLNLQELEARVTSILDSIDRILKNPDIGAGLEELKGVLQDARVLVENVNGRVDPLADNLNSTITDARGLVSQVDGEVKPLADKVKTTLDNIDRLARDVDRQVNPISKSVTEALNTVKSAFESIDSLVGKKSPTRADLDNTLKDISGAARSLRLLADYLEQHPDALLKGKGGLQEIVIR